MPRITISGPALWHSPLGTWPNGAIPRPVDMPRAAVVGPVTRLAYDTTEISGAKLLTGLGKEFRLE